MKHTFTFIYVESDLPDGVTLGAWRRAKEASRKRRRPTSLVPRELRRVPLPARSAT